MGFWEDTWIGRAASTVGSGISKAASATWDGTKAVFDGRAVNAVVDGAKWVNDKAIKPAAGWVAENAPKLAEWDTYKKAGIGVGNYVAFVATNPVLAGRQAVQGLSNSVTGLAGFVADVGIYAVEGTGKLIYNAGAGVVNLGAKEGERYIDYAGMSKFAKAQDFLEEHTGHWAGFTKAELDKMVQEGKITQQEATFAAGTKYGFQAVGEVASFVAISAVTAGAGGAAMAAARGGSIGLRVAEAGTALARTGRLGEIAAKPLLWAGKDVATLRGLPYLEQAAALAKTAPEVGIAGKVFRGPLRIFDPSQTSHVFANMASGYSSGTVGYGFRAAEGAFKFFNPIQANGRSVIAWSIEGGGATFSFVGNNAKETVELENMRALDKADQDNAQRMADEMRQRLGLPPQGNSTIGIMEWAIEGGKDGGSTDQPIGNVRGEFQDNAQKDTGITHVFKINNGLAQPTDFDPIRAQREEAQRNITPTGPGMGVNNR